MFSFPLLVLQEMRKLQVDFENICVTPGLSKSLRKDEETENICVTPLRTSMTRD
jgi:hypothetical protein